MIDATTGPELDRLLHPALPRLRTATGIDATMAGPVPQGLSRAGATGLEPALYPCNLRPN